MKLHTTLYGLGSILEDPRFNDHGFDTLFGVFHFFRFFFVCLISERAFRTKRVASCLWDPKSMCIPWIHSSRCSSIILSSWRVAEVSTLIGGLQRYWNNRASVQQLREYDLHRTQALPCNWRFASKSGWKHAFDFQRGVLFPSKWFALLLPA